VPISDSLRARFGIDSMQRDGYMKNVSGIGPDRMTDIDYLAGRASVVWDLSDAVQNYSILSYADSKNNGTLQGLFVCKPNGLLDSVCQPTLALQKDDFYKIASDSPNPVSKFEQWQFINTTTWELGRALTVKNILSYADLEQTMRTANFGSDFKIPPLYAPVLANPALVGAPLSFYPATAPEGLPSNSQTTFVEELQFSGDALDDRLSWQAGLYYENSQPDGWSGILSYVFLTCENPPSGSLPSWQCIDAFGQGFVQSSLAKIEYTNMAAYTQGTYEISEQFRVTLGLRYTVDDTSGKNSQTTYTGFPRGTPGAPVNTACVLSPASATLPECRQHLDHSSDAPTGLIDVDYLPTPDLMLYAKYARGYRQGSINMFAPEGVQTYEPEEVDAWEIGSKWSFEAPLAGTLNIALFYNELTDQQLQYGYEGGGRSATTAIVNAGASTIQGAEIETTLELYEDLVFNLSYTWLDTKLDKINAPQLVPPYTDIQEPTNEGSELTFSPENTVVMSLNYRLPLAADVGDVTVGTSYTFIDEQLAIYGTYGMLDSRKLLNLNASWTGIMGSDFDASLFATNVTDEEYPVNVTGFYDNPNVAMDFRVTGEPRMVGARLRYNFR